MRATKKKRIALSARGKKMNLFSDDGRINARGPWGQRIDGFWFLKITMGLKWSNDKDTGNQELDTGNQE